MADIFYYTGNNATSWDSIVAQGNPIMENPDPDNPTRLVIRQLYMCRSTKYVRAAAGSVCPTYLSLGASAKFIEDGPRTPTGIADIVTFERVWST